MGITDFLSLSSIGGSLSLFMFMVLLVGAITIVFAWNKCRDHPLKKSIENHHIAISSLQQGFDVCVTKMRELSQRVVSIENCLREEEEGDDRLTVSDGGVDYDTTCSDVATVETIDDDDDDASCDGGNINDIDIASIDGDVIEEEKNGVEVEVEVDDINFVNTDDVKIVKKTVAELKTDAINAGHNPTAVRKMKREELLALDI